MASLFATVRDILPLFEGGSEDMPGYLNRKPCFGDGVPVLMCLKNAFSAPRTWSVLAGNFTIFLSPPDLQISSSARAPPMRSTVFGMIFEAISLVYWKRSVLNEHMDTPMAADFETMEIDGSASEIPAIERKYKQGSSSRYSTPVSMPKESSFSR